VAYGFEYAVKSWETPFPSMSYKSECQEKYLPAGPVPTLFCLGIQPNRLNVVPSSSLWFHFTVVTAPFVS
jgi:hypothetical protein